MNFDGPRRKGRFLKAKSPITAKVALTDFHFGDLDDGKTVMGDNAIRTIIHAKYHEVDELEMGVVTPPGFNADLIPADQRRSIIFPLDFTKDWERARKLTKDRAARQDDDDFDIDAQLSASASEEEALQPSRDAADAPAADVPATMKTEATSTPQDAAKAGIKAVQPLSVASGGTTPKAALQSLEKAPYASMDVVGKAIKGIGPGDAGDQFIPQDFASQGGQNEAFDPEAAPAAEYKNQIAEQKADMEAVQKVFDDAKHGGYQEGFKRGYQEGEEKAEIAERQKAAAMFSKVGELIHEFARLKHEILDNVQENFYELCQAMAESLLKREFSIRPEAFVTVLRKAIDEAVEPGKFKIKVHPETFARVEAVCPPDLKESLAKDAEMEPGDFRIESNLSVVDVNVRTMLKELLDQADLNLFQGDQEKAG